MSFNRQLRRTHRCKRINHPKSVPPSWSDCEHFQRRVGHESCVGVPELSFTVDETTLRILTGVYGKSSRETFRSVLVHPVTKEHDVGCKIIVVEVAVGIFGWGLADDDAAVQTVHFLETGVSVPEVGTGVSCYPLVSKKRRNIYGKHNIEE